MCVLRIFLVLSLLMGISACNTLQGIGKDIKKGGETLEKAAR